MQLKWKLSVIAGLLSSMTGCASLPDYARPNLSVIEPDAVDLSDVITYRRLERADFKGATPPPSFDERMSAVTCVYAQPVLDSRSARVKPAALGNGENHYDVSFENIQYRALMNRNCSWWNPRESVLNEAFILEHEQIHFALFEIATRNWSNSGPFEMRIVADSREALVQGIKEKLDARLRQLLQELQAQQLRFDEETSLGHEPWKQKKWRALVESQLPGDSFSDRMAGGGGCNMSDAARSAIADARRVARNDDTPVFDLIGEAEAAAARPACDSVRARILAEKAYRLATEKDHGVSAASP